MRVLVTGHRGYIGTVLVPLLKEKLYKVKGLDSGLYEDCVFGEDFSDDDYLEKDIRDIEINDIKGADAVVHLAALSNDPLGEFDPELTRQINYAASVRLAKLAKKANITRFIFASSCSNYGVAGDDWVNEESFLKPLTSYGESKVRAESEIGKLASGNFSPIFLRFATMYGVSPRLRFDLVLNNLVAWAYTTGKVHLKSKGTAWRPLLHVIDAARSIIAVLDAPILQVHNQIFNVGSNSQNYRVNELADIVQNTVPESKIEYVEDAVVDKRSYKVDCSKVTSLLEMEWDVHKGAKQLYESYKKNGLSLDDFEGPHYSRIEHIKYLLKNGKLDASLRKI